MAMTEGDGAGLKELQVSIGDSVPSATLTRFGEAWAEIVAVAKEQGADLIVISTHGRTGFEHALLGSTTEKVVRHAPCPVLVVRQREHEFVAGPASGQLSSNAFPDRGPSQISG
jgi:nucleotide-binding universal stress UspA family protein